MNNQRKYEIIWGDTKYFFNTRAGFYLCSSIVEVQTDQRNTGKKMVSLWKEVWITYLEKFHIKEFDIFKESVVTNFITNFDFALLFTDQDLWEEFMDYTIGLSYYERIASSVMLNDDFTEDVNLRVYFADVLVSCREEFELYLFRLAENAQENAAIMDSLNKELTRLNLESNYLSEELKTREELFNTLSNTVTLHEGEIFDLRTSLKTKENVLKESISQISELMKKIDLEAKKDVIDTFISKIDEMEEQNMQNLKGGFYGIFEPDNDKFTSAEKEALKKLRKYLNNFSNRLQKAIKKTKSHINVWHFNSELFNQETEFFKNLASIMTVAEILAEYDSAEKEFYKNLQVLFTMRDEQFLAIKEEFLKQRKGLEIEIEQYIKAGEEKTLEIEDLKARLEELDQKWTELNNSKISELEVKNNEILSLKRDIQTIIERSQAQSIEAGELKQQIQTQMREISDYKARLEVLTITFNNTQEQNRQKELIAQETIEKNRIVIERNEKDLRQADEQLNDVRNQYQNLENQLQNGIKEFQDLQELNSHLQFNYETLKSNYTHFQNEANQNLNSMRYNLETLTEEKNKFSKRLTEVEMDLSQKNISIETATRQIEKLMSDIKDLEAREKNISESFETLKKKKRDDDDDYGKKTQEIKSRFDQTKEELAKRNLKNKSIKNELVLALKRIEDLETKSSKKQETINLQREKLNKEESEKKRLLSEIDEIKKNSVELKKNISEKESALKKVLDRLSSVEEKFKSVEDTNSKEIEKLKQKNEELLTFLKNKEEETKKKWTQAEEEWKNLNINSERMKQEAISQINNLQNQNEAFQKKQKEDLEEITRLKADVEKRITNKDAMNYSVIKDLLFKLNEISGSKKHVTAEDNVFKATEQGWRDLGIIEKGVEEMKVKIGQIQQLENNFQQLQQSFQLQGQEKTKLEGTLSQLQAAIALKEKDMEFALKGKVEVKELNEVRAELSDFKKKEIQYQDRIAELTNLNKDLVSKMVTIPFEKKRLNMEHDQIKFQMEEKRIASNFDRDQIHMGNSILATKAILEMNMADKNAIHIASSLLSTKENEKIQVRGRSQFALGPGQEGIKNIYADTRPVKGYFQDEPQLRKRRDMTPVS